MNFQHPLIKNTIWMMGGFSARTVLQALYFLLIARSLGASEYGAFVAVTALVAILAPFASWGSGNLLIKHVARRREAFSTYWGAALAMMSISGSLLTLLVLGVYRLFLPATLPLLLVLAVAVADLIFARFADVSSQAFQAVEKLSRTAQIQALLSVIRLVAAALLFVAPITASALTWSTLYLLTTVITALVALFWVRRELGWGKLDPRPLRSELREGFHFALSLGSQSVYNDIDKTMLSRFVGLEAAGIYAAAYRIVDAAFSPVRALLFAAYARFFKSGQIGVRGSLQWAVKLVPWTAAYGLLTAAGLWLVAPLMSLVFGESFRETGTTLQWLAPLILLKALHYFAADTLTGAGLQSARSRIQLGVAALNICLNLWLLPGFGWLGAAWASLASDGVLVVALWSTVLVIAKEEADAQASAIV
ncbi:hypothetical protein DAETH_41170 (plasmid) [Deinococcus aetherius]|uniref:Polysaccharide biosynthesis protein n=1 Tax=Deinococcus aetherius TaxID=200252 RepID=A0ABM8AK95_9DEIO|nr:flippase [Deinococcus aetherius]BDP44148.1 hypothetical protein DAETH_41170 [Deinococcus aetherius]